jgi:tRNA/tmRNA/rRNA uracil-C5-methylase (TrmA/RlmC/RlmD family)
MSGAVAGFRHRARLAIRGRVGSPKLGLFEESSHRVVHIPNCSVHHPLINQVANVVRRSLAETGISCYSDKAHLGLVRYLQVVVERSSQTAQLVMVINATTPEPLTDCFRLIRERLGTALHSLWFNSNTERANTILGPIFRQLHGPASVVEHFGEAAIHYPPGAFGQNNLEMAEQMIGHVRGLVPPGATVAEFYAGVGAIGLSVLSRVGEIRMNEIGVQSLTGLELGIAGLDPLARAKVSVIPGAAGGAYAAAAGAQVVVADPPRKGLDPELTEYLARHPPERFVYVSCGIESLHADMVQLTSLRTLRLAGLTAFNFLPFTDHVETVAVFERT